MELQNVLVEVRFTEDATRESPGRLTGTLITFDEIAHDRKEKFLRDSLRWSGSGIVINSQHDRQHPIVRAFPFLDGDELKIDAQLPNSTAGRDCAVNVREKVLTGLSIEFAKAGVVASYVGGIREIRSAVLVAAGLVDTSSYTGSKVEIREHADRNHALEVFLRCL